MWRKALFASTAQTRAGNQHSSELTLKILGANGSRPAPRGVSQWTACNRNGNSQDPTVGTEDGSRSLPMLPERITSSFLDGALLAALGSLAFRHLMTRRNGK